MARLGPPHARIPAAPDRDGSLIPTSSALPPPSAPSGAIGLAIRPLKSSGLLARGDPASLAMRPCLAPSSRRERLLDWLALLALPVGCLRLTNAHAPTVASPSPATPPAMAHVSTVASASGPGGGAELGPRTTGFSTPSVVAFDEALGD